METITFSIETSGLKFNAGVFVDGFRFTAREHNVGFRV